MARLQAALKFHQDGRLAEAEAMYRQVLSSEPRNGDALHFLGMLAHQVGQSAQGVVLLEQSLQINPNNAVYFSNAGTVYRDLRKYDEAIAAYERAISVNPNLTEAHLNLGGIFLEKRELDRAQRYVEAALALRPSHAAAHVELGKVFLLRQKALDALEQFQAALASNPNFAEAQCNLGVAFAALDKPQEARGCFLKALALKPNLLAAHEGLGQLLFTQGEYDSCVQSYRKSKKQGDDSSIAVYALVEAKRRCEHDGKYHFLGAATEWRVADPSHIGATFQAKGGIAYSNELFVAELAGARAFGGSDLILCDTNIAIHELASHALGELADLTHEWPIKQRRKDKVLVDYPIRTSTEAGSGILLTGFSTYAFGHWLGDYLPKLKLVNERAEFRDLPIYVDLNMPATHFEALEMLTEGAREIVTVPRDTSVSFEKLVFASHFTFFPTLCIHGTEPSTEIAAVSPIACQYVRDTFLRICGLDHQPLPAGQKGRRIFIGRGNGPRKVANEEELQQFFVKHGFEIVYPAKLSFREQISLFNEAEFVAGPHGSAFVNVLFSRQGTKVINFVQSYASNFASWAHVMETMGHRHLFVCGDAIPDSAWHEHHFDYSISPILARQALAYFDLA